MNSRLVGVSMYVKLCAVLCEGTMNRSPLLPTWWECGGQVIWRAACFFGGGAVAVLDAASGKGLARTIRPQVH